MEGAQLALPEVDYGEALAVAYQAERDSFHRVAASALISAGYHDPVHAAEDVVLQAILSLLEHPVDGVKNYAALITTTIRRRAIDLSRSASATAQREQVVYGLRTTEAGDDFSAVEAALDAALAVEHIRTTWEGLHDNERNVVMAVAIHGEAQTAVAARLGVSKQRIGQLYGSAIATLRQAASEGEDSHGLDE